MMTNVKNIKDSLINIKYNYNERDVIFPKRLTAFLLEEKCDATFDNLVNTIIKYVSRHNLYDIENNTIKLDDKLKMLLAIDAEDTINVYRIYHIIYQLLLVK